jgi:hypothetical protein
MVAKATAQAVAAVANKTSQRRSRRKPRPPRQGNTGTKDTNGVGNGLSQNYKTTNQIEKSLMALSISGRNKGLPPYVKCRLNPFYTNPGGPAGIPDAGNTNFIVVDSLTFDTITCVGTGGFTVLTMPTLPSMALITGAGSVGATDININGVSYRNLANTAASISIPPQYKTGTAYAPGSNADDPYSSANARLVSVAYRIMYTGQANTCSGTITVTPAPIGFANGGLITSGVSPPSATTTACSVVDYTGAVIYQCPYNTPVLIMDGGNGLLSTASNLTYTKDSVCFRPEHGAFITPRHRTNDFKCYPTSADPPVLIYNQTVNLPGTNYTAVSRNNSPNSTGIVWYDGDWGAVQINVAGVQPGHTYRIECASCFEYGVGLTSAFSPLAQKTSESKPKEIVMANAMQASQPIALPLQVAV